MVFGACLALVFMGLGMADGQTHGSCESTVIVDPASSGTGHFKTIQSAIESVPSQNRNWVCINIKAGVYREQVNIPIDKPFIYLQGEDRLKTTVVWGASGSIVASAAFITHAENVVAKSITFMNSFNYPPETQGHNSAKVAPAAMISGDKSAFYDCGFVGFQDTLFDDQGRHYFKLCTIQGAVDFIFGAGQSIYEGCTITSVASKEREGIPGVITAQGRSNPKDSSGYVFKNCSVVGTSRTTLGRAWRDYARVLFFESFLSNSVVPEGWTAWEHAGQEVLPTFAEHGCRGPGSNTSKRVKWESQLSPATLSSLTSMSFIDSDDWISHQPFNMLA
ncbi:hypothetical protein RJ639_033485 [Escallonia herrerae]|uniref:Pectinesterase n=1 Tax=Escallonia herrerae TaxID=1293975 RepID=A0AA89BEY0_9ASTE|nr:hypothetical protein RJ639_033485 [Escallonia herrerae]